ncbi:hypothetical protein AWB73_00567 [Caballeronia turbans]|jgi:hypothetical protein|uniref:hypothetical protein n=1 Tax=unclassified Caballeronia TaxID=2646786 RepID=UPI00074C795F|nr:MULTISPECIES: hypothetical protein [unclassified Caballeronia]SAL14460.1 hypothetical protein AWB73_00567 [Caballeronia turbans]
MTRNAIPIVVCAVALAACSTNGANTAPPPGTATTTLPSGGVYKGALKGSTAEATLLTLFDGTAYLFYGGAGGTGLAGVAVAKNGAQSSDGRFTSDSAFDYRVGKAGALPVVFNVDFAHAPAVDGTVANKDGSADLAFSGKAATILDIAPSRANLGGLYSGRGMALGGTTQTRITVAGDGYLAGTTTSGCIFKGTAAPHEGANAYDVSVTFGPAPCPLPDVTVTGNAVLDGARLLVALPSPNRSDVFLFDGRK